MNAVNLNATGAREARRLDVPLLAEALALLRVVRAGLPDGADAVEAHQVSTWRVALERSARGLAGASPNDDELVIASELVNAVALALWASEEAGICELSGSDARLVLESAEACATASVAFKPTKVQVPLSDEES